MKREELIIRLKEFQREYNEISDSMRSLLDKGEVIRIKDFKEMLEKIRARQVGREKVGERFMCNGDLQVSRYGRLKPSVTLKGGESIGKEAVIMV